MSDLDKGDLEAEIDKLAYPIQVGGTYYNIYDKQQLLALIENRETALVAAKDNAYWERNQLVAALTRFYPSWLGRHLSEDIEWEDEWRTIIYVQLPTGQVSWHIHDRDKQYFTHLDPGLGEWDGHTTTEKYNRLFRLRGDYPFKTSTRGC